MNSLKNFLVRGLATLFAAVALLALALLLYAPDTQSQVTRTEPLPVAWTDITGSNAFGVGVSGEPRVIKSGVVYTGATTNIAYKSGAGPTNTLVFVNGVLTGVQ